MNNPHTRLLGFTLIELLVVISIIAILVTVSIISFTGPRMKTRDAERVAYINQINTGLELYFLHNSMYPTTLTIGQPLTNKNILYLNKVPSNPTPRNDGGCPDSDFIYTPSNNYTSYTLSFCLSGPTGRFAKGTVKCVNGGCDNVVATTLSVPGLVGWWKLNEGSGTNVIDYSSSGNNGTWSGTGVHYVIGRNGNYAAQFNGFDDLINIGNHSVLALYSNVSVFAWINSTNASASYVSWGSPATGGVANGYYGIGAFFGTGREYLYVSGWRSSVSTFFDGTWHFVGMTFTSSGDIQFYKDGVPDGSVISTGVQLANTPTNSLVIGRDDPVSNTFRATGLIDNVLVYNRALSPTEVLSIYNATK